MCNIDLLKNIIEDLKIILLEQNYTIDEVRMLIGYVKGDVLLEEIINNFTDISFPKNEDYMSDKEVSYAWKRIFDNIKVIHMEENI